VSRSNERGVQPTRMDTLRDPPLVYPPLGCVATNPITLKWASLAISGLLNVQRGDRH
jgi:hypothetical protein